MKILVWNTDTIIFIQAKAFENDDICNISVILPWNHWVTWPWLAVMKSYKKTFSITYLPCGEAVGFTKQSFLNT